VGGGVAVGLKALKFWKFLKFLIGNLDSLNFIATITVKQGPKIDIAHMVNI